MVVADVRHVRRPSAASSKEVCWSATLIRSSWRCSRRCLVSSDSWFLGRSTDHLKNSTKTMWPGLLLGKDPRKWHCTSQFWRSWMSEISRVLKPMRHVAFFHTRSCCQSKVVPYAAHELAGQRDKLRVLREHVLRVVARQNTIADWNQPALWPWYVT